ncbi:MAG: outer membrane lipoprotein-sorting protein [Deltaproteobacteria bacterium]|nr:outer membrane lipoprotein-sorting protein [Deltaproteobacteria bacterium]
MNMKWVSGIILFQLGFGGICSAAAAAEPNEIVAKADLIRAPKGSYEFEATVTTYEGAEKKSENGYKVFVRDLDHSLVEFRVPASEKGKSLLMVEEDLWIYLPKVKKPVRIPLQQRLVGDVSNGDMARANFSNDYAATLAGEEKVEGKEVYVLDLVATSPKKTYNKIRYWVSKPDNRPVQAEYFTVSGQSLKTVTFEDFRSEAGAVRPMRLVFRDTLNKNKRSILEFKGMVRKELAENMFTKDYMKTLE